MLSLNITKQNARKIPLYSKANWDTIRSRLQLLLAQLHTTITENTDINTLWNEFTNIIRDLSDKYIPHKVTRSRCSLPWITTSIRRLIRRRDKLYCKFKQSKSEDTYEDFKTTKHTIQKEMRKAYWSYINNIIAISFPR